MNTAPDFLGLCRESFVELAKRGFESREETDREDGQFFELIGDRLRLSFRYYPPTTLVADIGPNAIGPTRDRRNLQEVLRLIGSSPHLPEGIRKIDQWKYEVVMDAPIEETLRGWVNTLAPAVISNLEKLQEETDRRLKQQGAWQ